MTKLVSHASLILDLCSTPDELLSLAPALVKSLHPNAVTKKFEFNVAEPCRARTGSRSR
jgi:hypothetical protein